MATTTKLNIIKAVQKQAGILRNQSADVVEAVFEVVSQRLEQGESVNLSGFAVLTDSRLGSVNETR